MSTHIIDHAVEHLLHAVETTTTDEQYYLIPGLGLLTARYVAPRTFMGETLHATRSLRSIRLLEAVHRRFDPDRELASGPNPYSDPATIGHAEFEYRRVFCDPVDETAHRAWLAGGPSETDVHEAFSSLVKNAPSDGFSVPHLGKLEVGIKSVANDTLVWKVPVFIFSEEARARVDLPRPL